MPPKYIDDARSRIQSNLKKFGPILNHAKSKSLNEADTRDIVKAMIHELLGFDPFFEVTGEFSVKGQYADFAVKIGEEIRFFVEVKSIEAKLDEKHLYQVIGYAANHGVEWAVLTNGARWQVYRLFAGESKKTQLVLDFEVGVTPSGEIADCFLKCCKEGFRQDLLSSHWSSIQAFNPLRVATILTDPSVLTCVRKELKKQSGMNFDEEAIADLILNRVIRGDLADQVKG